MDTEVVVLGKLLEGRVQGGNCNRVPTCGREQVCVQGSGGRVLGVSGQPGGGGRQGRGGTCEAAGNLCVGVAQVGRGLQCGGNVLGAKVSTREWQPTAL